MQVMMQTMTLIEKRLARNERQMAELRGFVLGQGHQGGGGDGATSDAGEEA